MKTLCASISHNLINEFYAEEMPLSLSVFGTFQRSSAAIVKKTTTVGLGECEFKGILKYGVGYARDDNLKKMRMRNDMLGGRREIDRSK